MKQTSIIFIITLLLFASCVEKLNKKRITIKGVVIDKYTKYPISDNFSIHFKINDEFDYSTLTDKDGLFEIKLIEGEHYTYINSGGFNSSYTIKGDFICKEGESLVIEANPVSTPTASILHYEILEHTNIHSKIKLDFFIADGIKFLDNYSSSDISFSKSDNTIFNITDFQKNHQNFEGNYSVQLSIDQSGSIEDTDPDNRRLIAANLFCARMSNSDYVYLTAFATNGVLPYEITGWGEFTNKGSDYFAIIDKLKNRIGGGTPLYKAVASAVSNVSSDGPAENKAVIVFTDGEDTEGGRTVNEIIQLANNLNVKIYTVGLGNDVNNFVLAKLANNTGGASLNVADSRKLISFFGVIGDIIKGKGQYYSIMLDVKHPDETQTYKRDFLDGFLKFKYNENEYSSYFFLDL